MWEFVGKGKKAIEACGLWFTVHSIKGEGGEGNIVSFKCLIFFIFFFSLRNTCIKVCFLLIFFIGFVFVSSNITNTLNIVVIFFFLFLCFFACGPRQKN